MIGMPGQDGESPVQLLRKHGPRQEMRPGKPAEPQQQVGCGAGPGIMAIGWTQQEPHLANSLVAPPPQLLGKGLRRKRLSPLVKRHGAAAGRRRRKYRPLRKLGQLARPGNALQIALHQFRFGRATGLPESNNVQLQSKRRRSGRGISRANRSAI